MYKIENIKNTIIQGDSLEELKKFPDNSIDTIITSPPYWGLRDYQIKGQIGLEPTLEEYLERLLAITKELKRVLKKSGVMFWNHGDCYNSHSTGQGNVGGIEGRRKNKQDNVVRGKIRIDLPDKCLVLQNWRLILRMIDDQGWILRNTIIWHKPNHMPSSVHDRFASSYEPVFMLVKNKRYYFDLDAVRIPYNSYPNKKGFANETEYRKYIRSLKAYNLTGIYPSQRWMYKTNPSFNYRVRDAEKKSKQCPQFKVTKEEIERYKKETGKIKGGGANLNLPYNLITGGRIYKKHTHYPQDQAENFGSPRARYWRKGRGSNNPVLNNRNFMPIKGNRNIDPRGNDEGGPGSWRVFKEDNPNFTNPKGKNPGDVWKIATHPAPPEVRGKFFAMFPEKLVEPMILAGCPKDGIVLDPFMGSGTIAVIAKKLKRNWIGIELSKDYCEMARARINNTPNLLL